MSNTLIAGMWRKDAEAYDPQARVREFTLNGRQFTAHSLHADGPDQWPMTVREAVSQRYVATVSNWRRLPEELASRI